MASAALDDEFKKLKIDSNDINILLLGETGVGKSTFINAIVNYLTYSTDFEKIEKSPYKLTILIPSIINIEDKYKKTKKIHIGKTDQNEILNVGESATQDVKTYVFPVWNNTVNIRIIDTPGMGDTRGIEQDHVNSENILSYISQLDELHAICFLFRPDNARSTVFFQYCIAQIFSRLDKSASNNIIFVFTGTRGSNYGPGDTMEVLRKTIDDIRKRPPHVQIPLNRNIFCFENESFKYLAALAAVVEKVEFPHGYGDKCRESWKKSSSEIWKLVHYIVGDRNNKPLEPHLVKNTKAVNEARRMITNLAKPLADVSELINDNINILQRHEEVLKLDNLSLDQLRKKLYMPTVSLKTIEQSQPVTVCASRSCAELYKVGDINKWHYKQRCHDPCYLQNVPKEIIGTPQLIHCAAMGGNKKCQKCSCDFSIHMHIYYMTKTVDDKIKDDNVEKNIHTKEQLLHEKRKLISNIKQRKGELDYEQSVIIKTCAKFAHFLENNAITPFSDSYKEYIIYLINREQSLGPMCNPHTLEHLQRLLREYEEAKKFFEEAKRGAGKVEVTPQEISQGVQDLYNLKHNGKQIKRLLECQTKSRNKEYKNTEYVHKGIAKQTGKKYDKKDKKTNHSDNEKRNYNRRDQRSDRHQSDSSSRRGDSDGERRRRRQTEYARPNQQRMDNHGNYRYRPDAYTQQHAPYPQYSHPPGPYHYPTAGHSDPNYHNTASQIPPLMGVKTMNDQRGQFHGNLPEFNVDITLDRSGKRPENSSYVNQQYSSGHQNPHDRYNPQNPLYHHAGYGPNSSHVPPSNLYPHQDYNAPKPEHYGYPAPNYPYYNHPPQGYHPSRQFHNQGYNSYGGQRQYGNNRSRPNNRGGNFRGGNGRRGVNKNYKSENQKKSEYQKRKVENKRETDSEEETESDSSDSSSASSSSSDSS